MVWGGGGGGTGEDKMTIAVQQVPVEWDIRAARIRIRILGKNYPQSEEIYCCEMLDVLF